MKNTTNTMCDSEISGCSCIPKCTCRVSTTKYAIYTLSYGLVIISWFVGIVLAKGFWSTLIATILPPWGWYLFVEKLTVLVLGPI